MLNDYSVKQRTVGVGVLTKEVAIERGVVGPVARASGVVMDHRVAKYGAYANVDVEPQIEPEGDCYARTKVRMRELYSRSISCVKPWDEFPKARSTYPSRATRTAKSSAAWNSRAEKCYITCAGMAPSSRPHARSHPNLCQPAWFVGNDSRLRTV